MGPGVRSLACVCMLIVMADGPLWSQTWDTIPPPLEGGFILSSCRKGNTHYALHGRDYDRQLDAYVADLYKSTDDGESWQHLGLPTDVKAMINRIAIDSLGNLLYHTEWSVYRSSDDGVSWSYITDDLDAKRTFVGMHIDSSSRLFLVSAKVGLVMTTNYGNTWSHRTLPSPCNQPTSGRLVCVGDQLYFWWELPGRADTLFRSTNQGATWSPFLVGRSPLAVIDGGNGNILVSQRMFEGGTVPFRILATHDDGQSWDTLYSTPTVSGSASWTVEKALFRRSEQGALAHVLLDTTGLHMF